MEDVLPDRDDNRHLIDMEATYPSNPATIVGIFCLKFALSQNAIETSTELVRLKMDVSEIKNVDQVLSSMTSAHTCLHNICVFIMLKVCCFTVELIHLNFEIFGVKNAIKFPTYCIILIREIRTLNVSIGLCMES